VLVDEELGPCLPVAFRNYFRKLSTLSGFGSSAGGAADELGRQVAQPRRNRVRKVRVSTDHAAVSAAIAAASSASPPDASRAAELRALLSPLRRRHSRGHGGSDSASSGESGGEDDGGDASAGLLGAAPFASMPTSPVSASAAEEGGGAGAPPAGLATPAARSSAATSLSDEVARRAWTEVKKRVLEAPGGAPPGHRFALAVNPHVEGRIQRVESAEY
jgi:hypothetical protein